MLAWLVIEGQTGDGSLPVERASSSRFSEARGSCLPEFWKRPFPPRNAQLPLRDEALEPFRQEANPQVTARLLIVDDEHALREELSEELTEAGYQVRSAADAESALDLALDESFDVCVTDVNLPGKSGIDLLKQLRSRSPETLVILITAYGDLNPAVEGLRHGASDYVLKPLLIEDLEAKVRRLVSHRRLMLENRNLRHTLRAHEGLNGTEMIGESEAMKRLLSLVAKVGPTDSNVLILGESGTGKELVARALHNASTRKNAPLVPINCAAIPENLLESELFGHVRGAFTGAESNKEGLLKTADEGTIFLDELAELPLTLQAKLLRAIESREIQPVGSVRRIPIHARIVAATNTDLRDRIDGGTFREDLYYRLAVVELLVPPLRDRRDDIPLLIEHFVSKCNDRLSRSCLGVEAKALRHLVAYPWRGNVRELENVIERAVILSERESVEWHDLPSAVRQTAAAPEAETGATLRLSDTILRAEHEHIQKVLRTCDGDKREAARLLEISLSSLYSKLDRAARAGLDV